MTATQLKEKIDAVLAEYPGAAYVMANQGIVFVFTDGVTKPASGADVKIDINAGKMWLLQGVTI